MISCKTSPFVPDPEINEFLTVEVTVELPNFSPGNPELKVFLDYALDVYSTRLKDLYAMQKTGVFISEELEAEITFCQGMIDWINDIVADTE